MLASAFKKLHPVRVLVVGDFLLDHYTIGHIERISPEAPVPVMHIKEESCRPGGAGNVALNLRALGAEVSVLGMIGKDPSGNALISSMQEEKVITEALFQESSVSTIVKKRLISSSQQLMRLDYEAVCELTSEQENKVIQHIAHCLNAIDVIALSDYNKGFLTPNILKALIKMANDKKVPLLVDPKGDDFSKYRGATLIKPNLKEAYLASKLNGQASIDEVASVLIEQAQLSHLVITRSEKGISLFDHSSNRYDFPVVAQEVMDVTGAGDTVLAVLAFAVGNGLSWEDAIQLANLASGIAIGRLGCVHVTLSEIASRLLEVRTDNKIFEEDHLFPLIQVLRSKEYIIFVVDNPHEISLNLLAHLKDLKDEHYQSSIVLYIEETPHSKDVAPLLSSFSEVDFVILKKEGLSHLLSELNPKAVAFLKENRVESLISVDQVFERLAITT